MRWTEEQQEVISTRDKNILVSAAAGSGKTAVLTERILKRVLDEEHPVDIDKMVVVTFTKAAAGEMRERILKALQNQADVYMEQQNMERYEYMQRQLTYIHNARITTIDSFCLDVVRENFAEIHIDPVFKIGEEGELTLLKADVMAELLERHYENADEKFLNFVDVYSSSRSDKDVEEMILTMYRFAMSYPYPEEWIRQCLGNYEECRDSFEETKWYQAMKRQVDSQIALVKKDVEYCLALTREPDGPWAYESAVMSDLALVQALDAAEDYEERQRLLAGFSLEALSRKKQADIDEHKKELVKAIRDDYKKLLKNLAEKNYDKTREEVLQDIGRVSENAAVLVELTIDFIRSYGEAKREKNLVDFSDLEHFALEILVNRDAEGNCLPSAAARRMAEDIAEVMIDEYQDSNYVQELILQAISGAYEGRNNRFMVGDVKQSIYKFRMAKPELFLEKYDTYERAGDGADRKIILSKNFRSRKTILDVTNKVFEKIMVKELGGIVYDEANALYYGASYESEDSPAEILIADMSAFEEEPEDMNAREMEAEMVALRILELIKQKFQVTDKATGTLRDVRYSDIVVLLRSMGSYAESYEKVFQSKGIPVKCPVKKSSFDSFEVRNILEFLSIIDNPRQDIPLVAVLKNIFRFTEDEIALVKILGQCNRMYENVCTVLEMQPKNPEEENLQGKLREFYELLQKYRKEKVYLSIYDLIHKILEETGFEYFVSAFPDGTARLANLAMLKEKASVYQQGSYSGLFNFVRYIEKNQMYQVEQEVILNADEEQAVTFMSIHKSKGLEFPVVVIGALGKQFNNEDASKKIVLHQNYGMGLDMYDKERYIKNNTLMKRCLSGQIIMENLAEELRVLYVAMTRAKEKLILAGNAKMKNKWEKYYRLADEVKRTGQFHLNQLLGAKSYMDLVLMSLMKEESLWENAGDGYVIRVSDVGILAGTLVEMQYEELENKDMLEHWDATHVYKEDIGKMIAESLAFEYPYKRDISLKAKVSISEIKHRYMEFSEEQEGAEEIQGFSEEEIQPRFLAEKDATAEAGMSATDRGTAYHRVFELLDYDREFETDADVTGFLEELQEKGLIDEATRNCIRRQAILTFVHSEIGQRMKRAYRNGRLWREQPFVMNIPAKEVEEDYEGEETQLVQGIIDAYFEEDNGMCVVDYKTDNVSTLEELDKRYHAQLKYYGEAVARIAGKPVKDCVIYSVRLGRQWKVI